METKLTPAQERALGKLTYEWQSCYDLYMLDREWVREEMLRGLVRLRYAEHRVHSDDRMRQRWLEYRKAQRDD